MIKLPVYNLEGKETEKVELKDKSFSVDFNSALVHQVVVSLQNNKRVYTAQTKTRGEVKGGGKKPWKQKGTGRARAGSIRSPLWVGGGITFGPRNNRNYSTKINKKAGRLAFAMVLAKKSAENEVKLVENWKIEKPKTKLLSSMLDKLGISGQSLLLVTAESNSDSKRAARNLPKVNVQTAASVSTLDLLSSKIVLIEKEAIKTLGDRISRQSEKKSKILNPNPLK